MKRAMRIVLILVCLAVMGYSGFQIYRELAVYHESDSAYESLTQYVSVPSDQNDAKEGSAGVPEIVTDRETGAVIQVQWPQEEGTQWPEVDFQTLKGINPEIVGWLYSEGTVINYPVAQASNNDYYLHHLFDGTYHKSGCLFLDADNASDFSDTHSVIYGHHMRNGSMFNSLEGYKKQEYYEQHPVLLLMTPQQNYQVILFAGYVCPGDGDAWELYFPSPEDRAKWVDKAIGKSTFESGIVPSEEDRIITLSTCSYEYEDARYVVLGILRGE